MHVDLSRYFRLCDCLRAIAECGSPGDGGLCNGRELPPGRDFAFDLPLLDGCLVCALQLQRHDLDSIELSPLVRFLEDDFLLLHHLGGDWGHSIVGEHQLVLEDEGVRAIIGRGHGNAAALLILLQYLLRWPQRKVGFPGGR